MDKLRAITLKDFSYILLFIILVGVMFMSVQTSAEPEFGSLIEIEVVEGDTLWAIAAHHSDGVPIQSYLLQLIDYNEIQDNRIYPGQKLVVPKQETKKVIGDEESDNLLSSKY